MKRFHVLWLCLCLLLTLGPARAEPPQVSDRLVSLPDGDYVNAAALAGGQVYLLGSRGLYRWRPGDEAASLVMDMDERLRLRWQHEPPADPAQRALWEEAVSLIFSDGSELLALQPHTLQAFALEEGRLSPRWRLPAEALREEDQPLQIRSALFHAGRLCLLLGQPYSGQFTGIAAFDPASGKLVRHELPLAESMTAGPGDQLLVWLRPEDQDKPEQGGLFRFDAAGGRLGERLLPHDQQTTAFAWDGEGERLLFWQAGELMALDAKGERAALNYLAMDGAFPGLEAFALPGQGYALAMGQNLIVQDASGQRIKDRIVLRTMGVYGAETAQKYMAQHPEVAIQALDDQGGDGILSSLTARQDDVDIYQTHTLDVFNAAVQKGYALRMDSRALNDRAAGLLEPLQALARREGGLYGFPASLQPQVWAINLDKWEELGLGDRPTTLREAFEAYRRWNEELAEDNPEFVYMTPYQDFSFYVDYAVSSYILGHAAEGEPLRFDTPVFRQVLSDLEYGREALRLTPQQEQIAFGGQYEMLMTYSPGSIGEAGLDSHTYESLLPLAITEGEPRRYSADVSVLFVHANSRHPDIAQDYVNYYVGQLDSDTRALLFPAEARPRRQNDYERLMKDQQDSVDQARRAAEAASDGERRALEEKLREEEARLERYDRNLWEVSPRSIELRRELLPQLRFPGPHAAILYAQRHQSLTPIFQRYAQGQLPADQFISELESVAKLIYLEEK